MKVLSKYIILRSFLPQVYLQLVQKCTTHTILRCFQKHSPKILPVATIFAANSKHIHNSGGNRAAIYCWQIQPSNDYKQANEIEKGSRKQNLQSSENHNWMAPLNHQRFFCCMQVNSNDIVCSKIFLILVLLLWHITLVSIVSSTVAAHFLFSCLFYLENEWIQRISISYMHDGVFLLLFKLCSNRLLSLRSLTPNFFLSVRSVFDIVWLGSHSP